MSSAQDDFAFYATTNAKKIIPGTQFKVSFTLKNGNNNIKPPSFEGFQKVGRPSRSVRDRVDNGRYSSTVIYTYVLQADKQGTFTISPATSTHNNNTVSTNSLRIQVVKGVRKNSNSTTKDNIFVKAEVSKKSVYVKEPFILSYKLYSPINLRDIRLVQSNNIDSLTVEKMTVSEPTLEVVSGVQYTVTEIFKGMIIPTQEETLLITPLAFETQIRKKGKPAERITLQTKDVRIKVKVLPLSPPEFSGGIGVYKMGSILSQSKATTDDVLTLRMRVEGTGPFSNLENPTFDFGEYLEVQEPTVTHKQYMDGDTMKCIVVYDYFILPQQPGNFPLTATYTYFNPETGLFKTIKSQTYDLQVGLGKNPKGRSVEKKDNKLLNKPILPPINSVKTKSNKYIVGSFLMWISFLLPLSILGYFGYKRYQQYAFDTMDDQTKNKIQLDAEMNSFSSVLQKHYDSNSWDEFFSESKKAVQSYLQSKYGIEKSNYRKDLLTTSLTEHGMHEEEVQDVISILETCDNYKFSGISSDPTETESFFQTLKSIIHEV